MSTSIQFVREVLGNPEASDRIDIISSDRTSLQSYIRRYRSERAHGRNVSNRVRSGKAKI